MKKHTLLQRLLPLAMLAAMLLSAAPQPPRSATPPGIGRKKRSTNGRTRA